jgi:Predicted nucleotide-binding protein containing TIR-like domain
MGRIKGQKNRNYPSLTLEESLAMATAIQEGASGMAVSRLTLAELLDRSPSSSTFREVVFSSRTYGLTTGGINSEEFELTALGNAATGADEVEREDARRRAVLTVDPYALFFRAFNGKKLPTSAPFKDWLVRNADVPQERAEECMERILEDARFAGLLKALKGGDYVSLGGGSAQTQASAAEDEGDEGGEPPADIANEDGLAPSDSESDVKTKDPLLAGLRDANDSSTPKKVFIAHGRNRVPLQQLKEMLDRFKVRYAVAVDEPNQGRPISAKVASLMRDDCSSAIFIFTADERFEQSVDGITVEIFRPSENVVFELGAASVLYDKRIVIFKEKGVTFPSDFSDLGYIEFETDALVKEMGSLFSELVGLDILEVRAKG